MASSKIISPMEASLKKAASEDGPERTVYNAAGHVFSYGEATDPLKNLCVPMWPDNLLAEGDFSGSSTKPGTVAGRRYEDGFNAKRLDPQPDSPTWKKTRR